jgi:hypothetical protein
MARNMTGGTEYLPRMYGSYIDLSLRFEVSENG